MEETLNYVVRILLSILLMMLSILLIDFGWMYPSHPLHWISIIGYFMVGLFWNHKIITGEYFR